MKMATEYEQLLMVMPQRHEMVVIRWQTLQR